MSLDLQERIIYEVAKNTQELYLNITEEDLLSLFRNRGILMYQCPSGVVLKLIKDNNTFVSTERVGRI